jgi:hypothetical protein
MYEIPAPFIPAAEGAVIELSRAVDHVAAHARKLSDADVDAIRREVNRLLEVAYDHAAASKRVA